MVDVEGAEYTEAASVYIYVYPFVALEFNWSYSATFLFYTH